MIKPYTLLLAVPMLFMSGIAQGQAQNLPSCPARFLDVPGSPRAAACRCEKIEPLATVIGSGPYDITSNPCRSARHQGLLSELPGDIVFQVTETASSTLPSVERNGILSRQATNAMKTVSIAAGTPEMQVYAQRLREALAPPQPRGSGGVAIAQSPVAAIPIGLVAADWTDTRRPSPSIAHFPMPVLPHAMTPQLPVPASAASGPTSGQTSPGSTPASPVRTAPSGANQAPPAASAPARPAPPPSAPGASASQAQPQPQPAVRPAGPTTSVTSPQPSGGTELFQGRIASLEPLPALIEGTPSLLSTARMQIGAHIVTLYGVRGIEGPQITAMTRFIASQGNYLKCDAQPGAAGHRCFTRTNMDIAEVALANGGATTTPDAPVNYREAEASAKAARKGIWAGQ